MRTNRGDINCVRCRCFPSPCDTSIPHNPGLNCLNLTATSAPQRFRVKFTVFSRLCTPVDHIEIMRTRKTAVEVQILPTGTNCHYPGSLPATLVNITSSRRHDARGDTLSPCNPCSTLPPPKCGLINLRCRTAISQNLL